MSRRVQSPQEIISMIDLVQEQLADIRHWAEQLLGTGEEQNDRADITTP